MFKVDCYLHCKSTKVKHLFNAGCEDKHITEDKIVLRYEKSGVKIVTLSFFNSAVSLNL